MPLWASQPNTMYINHWFSSYNWSAIRHGSAVRLIIRTLGSKKWISSYTHYILQLLSFMTLIEVAANYLGILIWHFKRKFGLIWTNQHIAVTQMFNLWSVGWPKCLKSSRAMWLALVMITVTNSTWQEKKLPLPLNSIFFKWLKDHS